MESCEAKREGYFCGLDQGQGTESRGKYLLMDWP